ncbi:MAG TPA: DNA polymerase Y family protein [Acidimicrobiales bacterium]|nr:DNA polymerase Y family protein [Acidimicrobiales bacterium]
MSGVGEGAAVRTLVAHHPDWPVVAAGHPPEVPVAVVAANRVVACSAAARAEGVVVGLRRREAQARCPEVVVVPDDPSRDLRAWERAVVAVEALCPAVEVGRAGEVALPTRGPSRYFGGDEALAALVVQAVDAAVADLALAGSTGGRACAGVADGRFAATLAARPGAGGSGVGGGGAGRVRVVPPGASAAWLAPLAVGVLDRPDLVDVFTRLGLRTLGDLAALAEADVLARFGTPGVAAHRLARGLDEHPPAGRVAPLDLEVAAALDPPAERVDVAAFVGRSLAAELHDRLAAMGLACTRVAIEAETEHGERLSRLWRHDGALSAGAIAERVRWQLDGWLRALGGPEGRTSGGLTLLRLRPDEVHPDHGRQLGFWGASTDTSRVARSLARVQGLLGPEAVVTGVVGGGRSPADQVRLVPWGDPRTPARPAAWIDPTDRHPAAGGRPMRGPADPPPPWPGRLPGPAPAVVHHPPVAAEVVDAAGATLEVSGRGILSASPAQVAVGAGPSATVTAWAGPWPLEERWWDAGGRRCARLQVTLADGTAHLLTCSGGRWVAEASYD